jgi:hypothetical protein
MKFKTFIVLAVSGILIVGVIAGGSCVWLLSRSGPKNPPVISQPAQPGKPTIPPINPDIPAGARAVDQDILNFLRQSANGDKVKDAFPGKPYKVSFYQDTPGSGWNRAKIDLNRNGKWEEKITIENGQMTKRQVATNDDENYDVEYRWRGGQWVLKQK